MVAATVFHSKTLLFVNQNAYTHNEDLCGTLRIDVDNVMHILGTVVLLKKLEAYSFYLIEDNKLVF